jgi:integrase
LGTRSPGRFISIGTERQIINSARVTGKGAHAGRNGKYFDLNGLDYHFKRLLKSSELPNIRFHDLRHSAATILLSMGVHPNVVQDLLGHSNISITLDIYSHVVPSIQQEAMNKLDDPFGGQEET